MGKHALLAPSSASRWLKCTKSPRIEEKIVAQSSSYADEGTTAHSLGELMINYKLGKIPKKEYNKELAKIEANEYYNSEMHSYCEDYALFVIERLNASLVETKDARLFTEVKLDLSDYIPESFGTGDNVIVADVMMEIIDLKYGKGVSVSADENKQMMVYALGAYSRFGHLYAIEDIRMIIYQPRIDNISTFEISVQKLLEWAEEVLIPTARIAFKGEGDFVAGDHCKFCKFNTQCRALMDFNMEIAQYEFRESESLTDEEIADILTRKNLFIDWLSRISNHALEQAVNHEKKWPGLKLVEGRSNRKIIEPEKFETLLISKGHTKEAITNTKLKGITDLEKLLGKKLFGTLAEDYVVKPPGKLSLVSVDDKRPEVNSLDKAIADFEEVDE